MDLPIHEENNGVNPISIYVSYHPLIACVQFIAIQMCTNL